MAKNISFIIDGFFCFNLYQHAKNTHHKVLNFAGLVRAICKRMAAKVGCEIVAPKILRNCYMGLSVDIPDLLDYEIALSDARFGMRRRPLVNGKEKAIDTMIQSDIKEAAQDGFFDYLFILAGDFDHDTLVGDLKDLEIGTILVTGEYRDGKNITACSEKLKSNCFETIDIFSFLNNPDVFEDMPATPTDSTDEELLQQVKQVVQEMMDEKTKELGRQMVFALQFSVAKKLEQLGIKLGITLSEFFAKHQDVFKVGIDAAPFRKTVSIKRQTNSQEVEAV